MRMQLPGRDVPWKELVSRLRGELRRDQLGVVAGSVSFAALLSLFPFLIFLVALAGTLTDPAHLTGLLDDLRGVVPEDGIGLIEEYLGGLLAASGGGLMTVGALGAMWAAGRGVRAFIHALNVTYGIEERRPAWRLYLVSTLTVLVSSVGLVLLLALVVALPAIAELVRVPFLPVLVWLRLPLAGLLMLLIWAAFDSILPARRRPYRPFTVGNLLGVGGWLIASWGFSVYVRNFGNFNATYGTLGGAIILLLWMNLSVQVFLLAAEVNGIFEAYGREQQAALVGPGGAAGAPGRPSRKSHRGARRPAAAQAAVAGPAGGQRRPVPAPGGEAHAGARGGEVPGAARRRGVRLASMGAAVVVLVRQWRAMLARGSS